MRDGRRPPLCYQETEALRLIRGRDRGKRGDLGLVYAFAVYCTMTELAEQGDRREVNREGFRANRREIAELSGTSTQTVDRVVHELEDLGLLHVDHRGEGGEESIWTLISPGAPKSEPPEPPEPEPEAPKTKNARDKQYHEYADPFFEDDPEADELTDGLELLRQGKKADGKIVTPIEMAKAAACIHTFNQLWEHKGSTAAGYGLGPNLSQIVMRAREFPSWDISKHVRLVESAWRIKWWTRNPDQRPSPSVIWSPRSFPNVVQDAKDEASGTAAKPGEKKKRYSRGE